MNKCDCIVNMIELPDISIKLHGPRWEYINMHMEIIYLLIGIKMS